MVLSLILKLKLALFPFPEEQVSLEDTLSSQLLHKDTNKQKTRVGMRERETLRRGKVLSPLWTSETKPPTTTIQCHDENPQNSTLPNRTPCGLQFVSCLQQQRGFY